MNAQKIMALVDAYLKDVVDDMEAQSGTRRTTISIEEEESRLALYSALEAIDAENLGLRLECQGLKAEIAEVKSYWKEAARKNAEMLAREANRLGGGL